MNFIMRRKCRNPRFTWKFSSGSRVGAFGIHQTFIQKSSKNVQKTRSDFALIFDSFHKTNLPKSCKKPPKNHLKVMRKINTFVDAFFIDFQLQNRSKIAPKPLPKTISNKNYKKRPNNASGGVWDPSLPLSPPWKTPVDRFAPELQLLSRLSRVCDPEAVIWPGFARGRKERYMLSSLRFFFALCTSPFGIFC